MKATTAQPASAGEALAQSVVEVVLANGRRVRCDLGSADDPRLAKLIDLAEGGARC